MMPTCSVPYCTNVSGKDARITFHPFPHETPLFLKKWLENIGRPNWRPGQRSVICCDHFEKDDFDRQGRLRIGSFPVKFPQPPFRKKMKVEVDSTVGNKSLSGSAKQNISPKPVVVLPALKPAPSSSTDKLTEISPKRKVLEESQPAAFTPGLVSSYSLRGCRFCGVAHNSNVNIFGQEGKDLSLENLLKKCDIQASETDAFPNYICRQCIPRLKTTPEVISTLEKSKGSTDAQDKNNTVEQDPPVIHSKPLGPPHASRGNRRVLLLEMCLRDGIPVKDMIAQAIQELTLRLTPKDSREKKPEGRIMFLDLQGGTDAFPEQMKKAISMLFPSSGKTTIPMTTSQKVVTKAIGPNPSVIGTSTSTTGAQAVHTSAAVPAESGSSPPSTVNQTASMKAAVPHLISSSTPASSKQAVQTKAAALRSPALGKAAHQPPPSSSVAARSAATLRPITILPAAGSNFTGQVSSAPVTIFPNIPGTPPTLRIAALPTSAPGGFPQVIQVPPINFVNIQPKPCSGDKATVEKPEVIKLDDSCDDDHVYEDAPSTFESSIPPSGINDVPPLVPISKEKPKEVSPCEVPVINIAKMRDSVVSKMSKPANQIKLGDKIVGIVLRDSDSKNDIHKKLQATFSAKTPASKDCKPKERPILPKGAVTIIGLSPAEVEGDKRLKPKILDVPSAVDSPSDYSDRRNARRLSLSYLWRKTGFLVSSYQKLFTWNIGTDERAMPVLTCRVCQYLPKSKHDVESHLTQHPDLQCPLCSKYFLKNSKVLEHLNVIHGSSTPLPAAFVKKKPVNTWRSNCVKRAPIRQFQCSRCDGRFKMRESLRRHASVCKERSPAERVICGASPDTCTVCSRTFTSQEALQEHVLCHVKRSSWLCDICGLVLKSASNYRTHIARHDELAHEYPHQCHVCKKRFKLQSRFDDHLKKHETNQQFICSSCGKTFNSLNGLRQHEILHGERKLQCKMCPSRFHRRDHLRIHESSHLKPKPTRTADGKLVPGTGRMFTCRFCVKDEKVVKFPNMRELMKHYSDEHAYERGSIPSVKKFECDRCNKTFINSTLLRHHHMWHAGLRPYLCSVCGAGFMIKERMRNHEMTHTNERPYKCSVCGKGFRSRNVLKQHKLIHNDPSQFYKCQYCDKAFSRIDNLRTHTRVHTGEKPWRCLHCSRQFRLRSECAKHIQFGHQVPPEGVAASIETLMDPLSAVSASTESESAIAAIAGITGMSAMTTVQEMELLIEEDDDMEECDEDSL